MSLTYKHPCEVFLQKRFYMCMNIVFGFSIELYLLSQAAMAMERVLATLHANGYEQIKALPAAVGVALSVSFRSTFDIAGSTQMWRGF
ncbi:unnamed protein product [Heligmosomoides polygyrus]|uniref:Uncharacterized protein n=1 Tax=Heligmosomoides polygyrus TaxID=6339 RepID=A0A3P8BE80_HELPZ|nr:unnamed protein product [Heligmosomoides polygyrus]